MSDKPRGRKPDYDLSYLNKDTDISGYVGCGWLNEDGSITVKFNVCVQVPNDPSTVLTLFRKDRVRSEKAAAPEPKASHPFDADIPF